MRTVNSQQEEAFPAWMERTVQLLGPEKCRALMQAHVLVAGLGGVGSAAAESLVRTGIGKITIVDSDVVQPSNINRQVPALHSTIGLNKADIMKARLLDINPDLQIKALTSYMRDETATEILERGYDFVVDAIDTLSPKVHLIEKAYKMGLPLASSMGSGGKTDPTKITITDFGKTYNCKLAYILRKKLRKMGVEKGFKVVFSTEQVDRNVVLEVENEPNKKSTLGTVHYIPAIFGSMLASIVVDGITGQAEQTER